MGDYTLCEMCQRVTVEAMKLPAGFEHYNDIMTLVAHEHKCRLCSLILDALKHANRDIFPKLSNSLDSDWAVRLWLGDLTEWKYHIETDTEEGPFPDLGFVIVVVTCMNGSFANDGWKTQTGENIMHGTIEVCDQQGTLLGANFR
jgi:hypothetical protein